MGAPAGPLRRAQRRPWYPRRERRGIVRLSCADPL